jgi:hypothetical protein
MLAEWNPATMQVSRAGTFGRVAIVLRRKRKGRVLHYRGTRVMPWDAPDLDVDDAAMALRATLEQVKVNGVLPGTVSLAQGYLVRVVNG